VGRRCSANDASDVEREGLRVAALGSEHGEERNNDRGTVSR
jgi:hypothetical protein